MKLKIQWHLRQVALTIVSYVICLTTVLVLVPCCIKLYHFSLVGLDMWPALKAPKVVTIGESYRLLWEQSLSPIVKWLPLTVLLDILLRRFAWKVGG